MCMHFSVECIAANAVYTEPQNQSQGHVCTPMGEWRAENTSSARVVCGWQKAATSTTRYHPAFEPSDFIKCSQRAATAVGLHALLCAKSHRCGMCDDALFMRETAFRSESIANVNYVY